MSIVFIKLYTENKYIILSFQFVCCIQKAV